MAILFTILGITFAITLVSGIIHKDDRNDLSYLEDC